jgi:flagellar motor switch protein FliN/FliY
VADDFEQIGQDEIEELLNKAKGAAPKPAEPPSPPQEEAAALDQSEIESLMSKSADGSKAVDQSDIESLIKESSPGPMAAAPAPAPAVNGGSVTNQGDMEFLLDQAERALASAGSLSEETAPGVSAFQLRDFSGVPASTEVATLNLVRDVELDLRIELGRTHMHLEEVLKLKKGAVVPLDKLAGDPVDIYVNGRLIARGEVLVLNDNFCVRVAELIAGESAVA